MTFLWISGAKGSELTLYAQTPQNSQTHPKNPSAVVVLALKGLKFYVLQYIQVIPIVLCLLTEYFYLTLG